MKESFIIRMCLEGDRRKFPVLHYHRRREEVQKEKIEKVSTEKIEEIVVKIITENQNNDRETGLGEVGSRLVKVYPDFDVRRYGYSLLSKFLETLPKLKLIQEGTKVSVTLYEDKSKKDMLEDYIIRQIQMTGMGDLSWNTGESNSYSVW